MAFVNASNVHIERDANNTVGRDQYVWNVNLSDSGTEKAFRTLAKRAAINAYYNSEQRFPPPNCYPGTRTEILEELSGWIDGNSKSTKIFWLYGSAGVGKSAIAQNLTEKYAGRRIAAAFFFSRNDSTRDKLDQLVASIAYQLCTPDSPLRPVLGPFIIEAIRSDPNIFLKSFENQFEKLLIEPCTMADMAEWDKLPTVIAIDGLDECVDHSSQGRLLAIIRKVVHARIPVPWVFIIFGRPEIQIRGAFDHEDFDTIMKRLAVQSSEEVNRDIRQFLIDHFAELRKKLRALRHEDESWPGEDAIEQLVKRAGGQFIFVVTVIKYIDTWGDQPQDRLDAVLRIGVESGLKFLYSDLDLLYRHILSTCQEEWEEVQPVLRLLVTPYREQWTVGVRVAWRSPIVIEHLLALKKGEVAVRLSKLHSVLQVSDDNSNIHITHASFSEFLSDANRSTNYYSPPLPESEYCNHVATLLLRTLSSLKSHYLLSQPRSSFTTNLLSWKDMLCGYQHDLLRYSLWHWDVYCTKIISPSPCLLVELSKLDLYSVVAARVDCNLFPYLYRWSNVLDWAKRFGQSTEDFVNSWESCTGFCIAFPPVVSRHEALWFSFESEKCFLNEYPMLDLQRKMLQELFSVHFEEYQWNPDARKTNNATTLPINAYSHTTLPKDWIIVRVTRANANVFSRVAVALKDDEVGQGLLLDDIRKDIRVTVRQNLVAKDDLIHLKQLFKERRELFFPGYDDWLPTRSLKAIGSDWKEERGGGKELRRWFAGILARR